MSEPKGIPFIHKPSRRSRSVRISIASDGSVIVTTPLRFPPSRIPRFVEEARDWIEAHQAKQHAKPQLLTAKQVFIFGKKYPIHTVSSMDGSIQLKDGTIIVSPLESHGEVTLLSRWLRSRAIEYIVPRVDEISKRMNVSFRALAFKQQKTRWGSCSSQKNLNFNWKLIHAPKAVIDYVIIHELSHLTHMHHQRSFWERVATFDPDYPHHRRWLEKYGDTED